MWCDVYGKFARGAGDGAVSMTAPKRPVPLAKTCYIDLVLSWASQQQVRKCTNCLLRSLNALTWFAASTEVSAEWLGFFLCPARGEKLCADLDLPS